jgi:hypothetical protein
VYKQLHCSHYNTLYQGNNSSFDLNKGRQKIKRGQTFLTGKAINSEIIIDDIEVIVDNKGDSVFGDVADKYPPVALSMPASDDLSSALPNITKA